MPHSASLVVIAVLCLATSQSSAAPTVPAIHAKEVPLPTGIKSVTSIAGLADNHVYFIADDLVYFYDGRQAKRLVQQPLCVSTFGDGQSMYPVNISDSEMQAQSEKYRKGLPKIAGDGRFNVVRFQALGVQAGIVTLYGSGDYYDARGGVLSPVWGRFLPGGFRCEGKLPGYGGAVEDAATDGESYFLVPAVYGTPHLSFDPNLYAYAQLPESFVPGGVTASGPHEVWTWANNGNAVYHLNGFAWDVRPIEGLATVLRVVGDGHGRAFALGLEEAPVSQSAEQPVPLLFHWDGQAWLRLTVPTGFKLQAGGLLAKDADFVELVGASGSWYKWWQGQFTAETGPDILVQSSWRSPNGHSIVAGENQGSVKLFVIGGDK